MGNCSSCARTVVKAGSENDPKSVFKYDKETRKIVYVGEDNVDSDIHPSITLSTSASASASRENSDNGSITAETPNSDSGSNDHLNENLNNVRSLLGEIAEYLDEDDSTYATGSVAASRRSESEITTPTANKSHDNSVVNISSRQAISPLLFETDDGVQTPYTNIERSKKFEELLKLSREQKMVTNARNILPNSPETDLVYKNPRNLYEDDSLLAAEAPSDEQNEPTCPTYAGRMEYDHKEEFWSMKQGFDDDLSNETSLAGIEHVLSEDISESDPTSYEDMKNIGYLLKGKSDEEDAPFDEEGEVYGVEKQISPSPGGGEARRPSTDASDVNTSNVSFGSFMHVSYVEEKQEMQEAQETHEEQEAQVTKEQEAHEEQEEQEGDDLEIKQPEIIETDLIIFSPDVDVMKKSVPISVLLQDEDSDVSYVPSEDEDIRSQLTDEQHEDDYSISTENAVNSSMISEMVISNEDSKIQDSARWKRDDEGLYVQEEEEEEETKSQSSDKKYINDESVAVHHATSSTMMSEVIVPPENCEVHVGDEVTYYNQATKVPNNTELKSLQTCNPSKDPVSHLLDESENARDIEEPIFHTIEEHGHFGVSEIVKDILCPLKGESNSASGDTESTSGDSDAESNQETSKSEDEQTFVSTNAIDPSSTSVFITEELPNKEEAATDIDLKSNEVMEREEIESSSDKKLNNHINVDLIAKGESGGIGFQKSAPSQENNENESKACSISEVNSVNGSEVVATTNENDAATKHSNMYEKEDLISDMEREQRNDTASNKTILTGEEFDNTMDTTEEVGNSITAPRGDFTEKEEKDSILLEEAGRSNPSPLDNLYLGGDLLTKADDADELAMKEVAADAETQQKEVSDEKKKDDTNLFEMHGTTDELVVQEKCVSAFSRKLVDMENKLKELESLKFSDTENRALNTKGKEWQKISDENYFMKTAHDPEGKKVEGSTATKKRTSNNTRPKPRTPPRRHPTPTKSSILREQRLNGKNKDALSRGRSTTSRSRSSHQDSVTRTDIDDDASVGSTNSIMSSWSGRSANPTPQRTRRNSSNWKNTPDDASVRSYRSIKTPLTITPNSLPWDEKDLRRRTLSPTGSLCSISSNLSDPELIRESRKTAHKRVVAVRSAEKKTTCHRKWDTTLFEKKKGCVRCLALASKKERNQYFAEGRHARIAMTTGGCKRDCFPSREFLRAYPELDLDDTEDIRLCRICFNAVHR